ncbi:MAG: hypothetical protein EPO12_07660 [Aquabacterium sp.]|nr:MAG: hypothetical protein EPO12_07660 [Aquabacterium sp.]
MGKTLVIQVHHRPGEDGGIPLPELVLKLGEKTGVRLVIDEDDGYSNIWASVEDPAAFWKDLVQVMRREWPHVVEDLRRRWMVVCEGEHGWDDYKTLERPPAAPGRLFRGSH